MTAHGSGNRSYRSMQFGEYLLSDDKNQGGAFFLHDKWRKFKSSQSESDSGGSASSWSAITMITRDMQGRQSQTTLDPVLLRLRRRGATGAVRYMSPRVLKNQKFENPKGHEVTLSCNDDSAAGVFCEKIGLAYDDDYDYYTRSTAKKQEGETDDDISTLI